MKSVEERKYVKRREEARNPDERPLVEWLTAFLVAGSLAAVVLVQFFVH